MKKKKGRKGEYTTQFPVSTCPSDFKRKLPINKVNIDHEDQNKRQAHTKEPDGLIFRERKSKAWRGSKKANERPARLFWFFRPFRGDVYVCQAEGIIEVVRVVKKSWFACLRCEFLRL